MDTKLNLAIKAINDAVNRADKAWVDGILTQIAGSAESLGNACEMLCSLMLETPEKWESVKTILDEMSPADPVAQLAIRMLGFTAESVLAVKNRTSF